MGGVRHVKEYVGYVERRPRKLAHVPVGGGQNAARAFASLGSVSRWSRFDATANEAKPTIPRRERADGGRVFATQTGKLGDLLVKRRALSIRPFAGRCVR